MSQIANRVPRWGVVHVHTDHSDGGQTVAQVVDAASRAELDFVCITDHNTIGARAEQGYHEDLLVAVDVEVTPTAIGQHVLAMSLNELPADLHERGPAGMLQEIEAQGAFAWIPHPRGFLNPWFGFYNSPWRWWLPGVSGLELSTYLVEWVMQVKPWNALGRLTRRPMPAIDPHPELLARWDQLNSQRPTAGFLGIDAHFRSKFGGWLATPAYEALFRTHNLVVWTPPPTGDAATDLRDLRSALRNGRFANVLGASGPRDSVRFEAVGEHLLLEIGHDEPVEVRWLRDGVAASGPSVQATKAEWSSPQPGVYRAEISRGGRLWALTNPIRVQSAGRATSTREVPQCSETDP